MGGPTYSVIFINNSNQSGSACLFQRPQDVPNAFPVAWFAKFSNPATTIRFQWTLDYSFVWAETGSLMPGVMFQPAQLWEADPNGNNTVTFTYNGFYTFQDLQRGSNPGTLLIKTTGMIPMRQASIGIGMSGSAICATQAQPNWNNMFPARPDYWITFGNYQQGEVLDPNRIPNAMQINFPAGVYAMTATLNADMSWTIRPSSMSNELTGSEAADSEAAGAEAAADSAAVNTEDAAS